MKPFSLLFLCLIVPTIAAAQEHPKAELFAGYSYVRTDEQDVDLLKLSGIPGRAQIKSANLHGWNLTINGNPTRWLGIVADFGGAYGSIDYSVISPPGSGALVVNSRFHSFLFGPQISVRGDKMTVFGRGLLGAVILDQSTTAFGQRFSADDTAFGYGAGGGVDVRLNDRVSLRPVQADVVFSRFNDETQTNFRFSTGFVFRNRD